MAGSVIILPFWYC